MLASRERRGGRHSARCEHDRSRVRRGCARSAAAAEAILAEDIHKSFGALEVLKGVSLAAREGDVVSVIGSSGSGKSTFLRCINLLEVPDRGRIVVRGEEIRLGERRAAAAAPSTAGR